MLEFLLGSGGPFLITFRESLEAALIIGIIAAYLKKTEKGALTKSLYYGTAAAIIASLALGIVLAAFYGSLAGTGEKLFEGGAAIAATAVLTYMIFWMARHSHTIKDELQRKVEAVVSKGYVIGLVAIAFIAVFREGVETVLFLTATGVQNPIGTIAGAAAGIAVVALLTLLTFKKIYSLNIRKFFFYSSILLIIFAAGLLGYGVHEFLEAAEETGAETGLWGQHAYDINPAANSDRTYPLLHEKGALGSIFKGLVGYDGNPEWLRVIVYIAYWLAVGIYVIAAYKPDNRLARIFRKSKALQASIAG